MRRHCAMFAAITILAGCRSAPRPIFPPIHPPIVWPPPPDRPRVRYVGELTGEASLGVQPSGWDALRAVLAGPPATIAFSTPTAVAVTGDRVSVSDSQLGAVHVLDLEARTYALLTEADGGRLQTPMDVVALDGGWTALADSGRAAVFVFDGDGRWRRTLGRDRLQRPTNLAWLPETRELWVLDAKVHGCFVFDLDGNLLRQFGGRGGAPLEFNYPAGIGSRRPFGVLVADSMNFRVQHLDRDGSVLSVFGRKGDAAGDFALPRDAAFDSQGHAYVLDSQFENVQVFDRQGRLLMAFGREGRGPGEFYLPSGITIDDRDRIWIADTYNRRVQVFEYLREDGTWDE